MNSEMEGFPGEGPDNLKKTYAHQNDAGTSINKRTAATQWKLARSLSRRVSRELGFDDW